MTKSTTAPTAEIVCPTPTCQAEYPTEVAHEARVTLKITFNLDIELKASEDYLRLEMPVTNGVFSAQPGATGKHCAMGKKEFKIDSAVPTSVTRDGTATGFTADVLHITPSADLTAGQHILEFDEFIAPPITVGLTNFRINHLTTSCKPPSASDCDVTTLDPMNLNAFTSMTTLTAVTAQLTRG